ncbi:uncharacterized protein LOC132311340 [Cornus florida]|uniref:uncharacterized protein LOC132311340 n=1 Tax=Cornus florida TaxID=4283 RepID=UPI0028A2565D|nr:uncharacterized protein LOC132311340 [Cornus florida]
MEDADQETGLGAAYFPPSLVSLTPFPPSISPSPRRLSSHFTEPSRPVRAARKLAWVSLQGRIVGAEEASSARSIGGGLNREEAVAWELFSPIHRILIVAVVAVASVNSKKNKQIFQLRRSVELRDKVLLSMQQKLDNLCEQMNYIKDQPECEDLSLTKNMEFPSTFSRLSTSNKTNFAGCDCRLFHQHRPPTNDLMGNSVVKASRGDEMFEYKIPLVNGVEQEERRLSDWSDWASSVTSSVDMQSQKDIEQDICNLKKECEEKDATIKKLSTFLHSSEVAGSKRITELEDIIRRKNMVITKLKKDLVVLEQKVVHLTRLRRPSFSASSSNVGQLPFMAENLIYDMDSTTSPSSSDSDCPPRNRPQAPVARIQEITVQNSESAPSRDKKLGKVKGLSSSVKPTNLQQKSRPVSPLKERSMNWRPDFVTLRPKPSLSAGGDLNNSRRRARTGSKDVAQQKRWA